MSKPEIQDIFRIYGDSFMENNKFPPHVQKAVKAVQSCRTSDLGGHMDSCDECGYVHISYNSCRNRHCPKCQALSKERWIMARTNDLLPVPYFHVVFTLPSELNEIAMNNQEVIYNLLFKASQETIRELARDSKYLGAEIGLTSILHTWGQNLTFHPHVHMIVPGGGLTTNGQWKNSRKKFFIPVKVMAKVFRGKFLYYLNKSAVNGYLFRHDDACAFVDLFASLYQKDWYVYCKRPFKTTTSVLEYLGRYTHRIAISNHRIISCDNGQVVFKWRDYKDSSKEKLMVLSANEFMRRFLLHILPPQFTKIRHYGFLSSATKNQKLALCRKLLHMKQAADHREKLSTTELIKQLIGIDITLCPVCGASLTRAAPGSAIA